VRKFDDILRDKLYEATNDNYSGAVWANIKGQIPIKKKSKSHVFWLASFLFIFAMMITAVHQYPNWKIDKEQNKTAEADSKAIRYSSIDLAPVNNQSTTSENYVLPTGNNQTAEVDITTLSDLSINDDLEVRQEIKENLKTGIAQQNAIPFSFKGEAVIRDAASLNPPVNTTSDFASASDAINISKSENTKVSQINKLGALFHLNGEMNVPTINPIRTNKRSKANEVHCEVLKGKQSKYYVSARHISSYAFNELSSKTPAADEYMTSRHITESKRYSFSDEVTFGIEYRSGLFAELGMRYDQINEKFNFLDPNAQQPSTVRKRDTKQQQIQKT